MDGTINKLRSNPFYIPNDEQSEEIWKAEQEERSEKEEQEKREIVYDVPPIHDNALPIHEVAVTKRKRKKYERKQTDGK